MSPEKTRELPGPFNIALSVDQVFVALVDYVQKHALVPDGAYEVRLETITENNVIVRVQARFTRRPSGGAA